MDILEGFDGSDLPLNQSRDQAMKLSSVLGSDEPLVSIIFQENGGDKKLAAKRLHGSTPAGNDKKKDSAIKPKAHPNKEKSSRPLIIRVSESLSKNPPEYSWS